MPARVVKVSPRPSISKFAFQSTRGYAVLQSELLWSRQPCSLASFYWWAVRNVHSGKSLERVEIYFRFAANIIV
jgi:hypothetical protein